MEKEEKLDLNEHYFELIRSENEKVGEAYFRAYGDYIIRNNQFDKLSLYQLLDFLKEKGHLSNLSHDAITSFIKYL